MDERNRFVKMAKSGYYDDDNDDVRQFTETQKSKISGFLKDQDKRLPKCTGGTYVGPVIATHNVV